MMHKYAFCNYQYIYLNKNVNVTFDIIPQQYCILVHLYTQFNTMISIVYKIRNLHFSTKNIAR